MKMQQKMSLVLPYEFEIVFKSLPLAEAGRLILAIYSYEQRKEPPNFSDNPMLQFAWETHIKPKIDENVERYDAICQARRTAGSKGGKATQEKQKQPNQANASFDKQNNQMQTNQADYDCDYDCDYEINKKEEEEKKPQNHKIFLDAWNALPIENITGIRGKRLDALRARLKEYSQDDILKAIDLIRQCPFLLGKNQRHWKITFDWFLKPNNFPKVLEGNYLPKEAEQEDRIGKVIEENQKKEPAEEIMFMDIVRAYRQAKEQGETRTLQEYAEEWRQMKRGETNGTGIEAKLV